jgi:hypothetical protein
MASALYGHAHRTTRLQWAPLVNACEVHCWRCGQLIVPDYTVRGHGWDLGHRTGLPSAPEHARRCNRSVGGRNGARVTHLIRRRRAQARRLPAW